MSTELEKLKIEHQKVLNQLIEERKKRIRYQKLNKRYKDIPPIYRRPKDYVFSIVKKEDTKPVGTITRMEINRYKGRIALLSKSLRHWKGKFSALAKERRRLKIEVNRLKKKLSVKPKVVKRIVYKAETLKNKQMREKQMAIVKEMYVNKLSFFVHSIKAGHVDQRKLMNMFFVATEYCIRNKYYPRQVAFLVWASQFDYFTLEHAGAIPDKVITVTQVQHVIEDCFRNGYVEKVGTRNRLIVFALSDKGKQIVKDVNRLVAEARKPRQVSGKFYLEIKKEIEEVTKLPKPIFENATEKELYITVD